MADESANTTAGHPPPNYGVGGESQEELDAEIQRSQEAASRYFGDDGEPETAAGPDTKPEGAEPKEGDAGEPGKDERPRDDKGRFVAEKSAEAEPEEPGAGPETKADSEPDSEASEKRVGPWYEAARQNYFTEDEINAFKDERDAEQHVKARRMATTQQALQQFGITPEALSSYIQWRKQQAQGDTQQPASAPQQSPQMPQAAPPSAPSEFKLDIKEEELAPEVVAALRSVEQYAGQLKESLAGENRQLRDELATVKAELQQSADSARAAQGAAQQAAVWDEAAKQIPGFVEVMGLPSEVRQLPPTDERVRQYRVFREYFQPEWERYSMALGEQNINLRLVMEDAFKASPFARLAGTGKKNGAATVGAGSVVRNTSSRKAPETAPADDGVGDDEEFNRILQNVEAAWGRAGGNPFRSGSQ